MVLHALASTTEIAHTLGYLAAAGAVAVPVACALSRFGRWGERLLDARDHDQALQRRYEERERHLHVERLHEMGRMVDEVYADDRQAA